MKKKDETEKGRREIGRQGRQMTQRCSSFHLSLPLTFIPPPFSLVDMAQQLQLEVVTPERRVLAEDVDMVTVPGLGGELGILPGHTPLISQLQTGSSHMLRADRPLSCTFQAAFWR